MMTRRYCEAVIKHGWKPYVSGHWLDFRKQRGGVILTFKDHADHEFKCSNSTANELVKLSKEATQ